ncbi:MAG: hypothetical protein AAFN77_19750 [Planctomycetota bacterium]
MKVNHLILVSLLLLSQASCRNEPITLVPASARPKQIQLKNKQDIVYTGKSVASTDQLPKLVKDAFFTPVGDTPIPKIGELTVDVDPSITVRFAKEVATILQSAGHKVAITAGDIKIAAPPLAVSMTSDEIIELATIKLLVTPEGKVTGLEWLLEADRRSSLDGELSELCTHIKKELSQHCQEHSTATLEFEIIAPGNTLATEFLSIAESVTDVANQQSPSIRVWPFGFPREEQPVEIQLPDF